MATIYVDPAGSNTSPYDTWAKAATNLSSALAVATSDGDEVILRNRQDHLLNNTPRTLTANVTIRNETDSLDFNDVKVTLQGNSSIKFLATGKTFTFRGITFDGGGSTNYTHTAAAFLFTAGTANDITSCTINFDHIRVTGVTADTTAGPKTAGVFNFAKVTTNVPNTINFIEVELDHCYNDVGTTGAYYLCSFAMCHLNFVGCNFHDNGVVGTQKIGGMFVNATDTVFVPNTNVYGGSFTNTWNGVDNGDGGVFYFASAATTGVTSTAYIEGAYWGNNFCKKGGAFWVGQNTSADVVRCTFADNAAYGYGGGAIGRGGNTYMATELGYMRVVSSQFVRNSAIGGGSGGAIFDVNVNGRLEIEHCDFEDNYSTTMGNTLYAQDRGASTTAQKPTLRNSRIYGDYSQGDGAHITGESGDGRWQVYDLIIEGGIKAISDAAGLYSNVYDANLDRYLRAMRTATGMTIGADFQSRTPTWANYDAAGTKWRTQPSIGRYQSK